MTLSQTTECSFYNFPETLIMDDTGCKVLWPSKLKANARNKKDPHIRVIGEPDQVQAARDKILSDLNGRFNRVTLKMDISYTDHSHIIGREGRTIQKVMSCTNCHIHFPDSNKLSNNEKSNQVSIAGSVEDVETARAQVRTLMPLVFMFEVGPMFNYPEDNPRIKEWQASFNVQVFVRSHPVRPSSLVCVKGNYWELNHVKQATTLLVNYFTGRKPNTVPVQMTLEISVQHHRSVCGEDGSNLKTIEERTGASISYPDHTDPTVPPLRKSTFTITGDIDSVFKAREMLLGCLPLTLTFDILEDAELERGRVEEIMKRYKVIVRVKPKPRQPMRSVILVGIERDATNIYETRRHLLRIDQPLVTASIPYTYTIPKAIPQIASTDSEKRTYIESTLPSANTDMSWILHDIHSSIFPSVVQPRSYWSTSSYSGQNGIRTNENIPVQTSAVTQDLGYLGNKTLNDLFTPTTASHDSASQNGTGYFPSYTNEEKDEVNNLLQFKQDLPPDRRAPGCEKAKLDYEARKMNAIRAMRSSPEANVPRVPTSTWSGLGFSQTAPGQVLSQNFNSMKSLWNTSSVLDDPPIGFSDGTPLSNSSYLDSSPAINAAKTDSEDLPSLLSSLNLGKYNGLFLSQEIDLQTFMTLTEKDLQDLGISTFGARRKLLLAIQGYKKQVSGGFNAEPIRS